MKKMKDKEKVVHVGRIPHSTMKRFGRERMGKSAIKISNLRAV